MFSSNLQGPNNVSILILVDQSLEPSISSLSLGKNEVSILILVDQSLEPNCFIPWLAVIFCFNPYSSGSVIGTFFSFLLLYKLNSFNPYSSGSVIGTFFSLDYNCYNACFNPYSSGSVIGTLILKSK